MPSSRPMRPAHDKPADSTAAVDSFMAHLEHPCKREIEALGRIILGVDPAIAEGIKWNAPSFRSTEYFATTHLRAKAGIGIVLHVGAKVRELPARGFAITDPRKLLRWLGKDRAIVEFASAADLDDKQAALEAVVREWIAHV